MVESRRGGAGDLPRPPNWSDLPGIRLPIDSRDTVEEKVLELQKTKRDLADPIINADNSLIRNLGRKDLELLLS
jgi:hypothetical protein